MFCLLKCIHICCQVVVGVMDKTLTGPDTELFGMCHRCVNVLQ